MRENLAKKIEKGTLYASNNGTIATFNLGFKRDDNLIESISYFYLYRQQSEPFNEYILCLTAEDSKQNLDLFQNELDHYMKNYLEYYLEKGGV